MLLAGLVDTALGQFGYAAVFAFVGIESLGIPFPGETMLVAAALYAGATHQLNIVVIVVMAATGAIIGDNIGYGIGHWGGYRVLLRFGHRIGIHDERIRLARYLFMQHGGKVVFFGRFVSVLRTYAAFLAGTARMPWQRFLVFNATGGVLWSALYGAGAYLAGGAIQRLNAPLNIALGVIAVLAIVAMIVALRRAEHRLSLRARAALPGPLEPP
jgi:membrane protein DedA with SNARE-associated domain